MSWCESRRSVTGKSADAEPDFPKLPRHLGRRKQTQPVGLLFSPVKIPDLPKARDPAV